MTVELPLLTPDIIGCTGANFAALSNAQLDQIPVFLLCATLVDNGIPRGAGDRKDPPLSPPVSYIGLYIMRFSVQHQKREENCHNFKHPITPFYLSLGIILTSFISLACSSSLRSLALWVVTAAPYVTHAVTYLPLLAHAPPSVAAKKIKIHRAFLCYLNSLLLC